MIIANPQNEALALVFHTDLDCYRLSHNMCESPNNYGVITGVTAGFWLQCPVDEYPIVEEWGQFSVEAVIPASIDIKPGSDDNCINNNGHGVIPVAILGRADFDITQVDPSTCSLAGQTVKAVGKADKLLAHIEDINGDGFDDLVLQIEDVDGAFQVGQGEATLICNLYEEYGSNPIEGTDSICIVP